MRAAPCAAVGLVAAHAFVAPGLAFSGSQPPRPSGSAPSEYVEVVPTGGGGSSDGSGVQSPSPADGNAKAPGDPGSAVEAAADAVGTADGHVLGLGVAMLVVTLSLAWAAGVRRGRVASQRDHLPNG